jgi:hypothetical protein
VTGDWNSGGDGTADLRELLLRAGFLPGEIFMGGPAGVIRQVWIVGERSQLTFHLRRNRHLTASAERLSRPDPITVVVIPNLFDVAYSTGLFLITEIVIVRRVSYKDRMRRRCSFN